MGKRQIHLNGRWVDYDTIPDCTIGNHTPIDVAWRRDEIMRRCVKCQYPLWNITNYIKDLSMKGYSTERINDIINKAIQFDAREEHLYIEQQNCEQKYY